MHLPRFHGSPSPARLHRIRMPRRPAADVVARRKDDDEREFRRLCGTIIVIAEEGRLVTVDELTGDYHFKPIFLHSHGARAAAHVARTRPDLAEALDHMKGAQ